MNETRAAIAPTTGPALTQPVRVILAALLALAAFMRIRLSLYDNGIYWPDEIYQSIEPAHRLVFGYGLRSWEFIEGARNWAFPGLLAGLLKFVTLLIGDHPRHYIIAIRLAFATVNMLAVWGTARLARVAGASSMGAALAALLFALAPGAIYLSPRALSESASTATVVWGLAYLLRPKASTREAIAGACWLGLSVMFRLQNGLFCLGALAILAARTNRRAWLTSVSVLGIWALMYGALDWMTWGKWFNSVVEYVRFNVAEGKSEQWGIAESTYYLRVLWISMPWIAIWVLPLALLAARNAAGLFLSLCLYVFIHSCVGHKEFRFVFPALPLLFALAGVGFDVLVARVKVNPSWLAGCMASCGLIAASEFHELTFGDLGQQAGGRENANALDDFGAVNRLLLAAHDRPDLCGLAVLAAPLAWTGGYSYLHRNVPIYSTNASINSEHFNYALVASGAEGRVVQEEGGYQLVALPRSNCLPDGSYAWKLP